MKKLENDTAPRITFDDYEKLMKRLEKEENFEQIQQQNPKAREYLRRQQEEDINAKLIEEAQRSKMLRLL